MHACPHLLPPLLRHAAGRALAVWAMVSALTTLPGCGGGGGSAGTPPATPPTTPTSGNLPAVDTRAVPAADPGSALPEGWMHGGLLQVYVRAYQDSNGDGIGDLRGLIQRLPYIQQLGVAGLWLMPITRSQDRDHGYAVTDYREVETDYGTLADLDELLRQAHARGLGVILDHVINHSAALHPAFVNARAAADNVFRDWYVWQGSHPAGWSVFGGDPWRLNTQAGGGWYYAPFWDQMPDFNLRNPAVVAWHHDHLRFWLNRGVDGFRFDAVGNLVENGPAAWESQPESRALMGPVQALLAGYSRRYLVCEAPGDPLGYAAASSCGSAFAFGHHANLVRAARGDTTALAAVAEHLRSAPATMATMLANHDSFAGDRLWNQFGGNTGQMKLAAALLLLGPGVPFIYYGEEIGMARAPSLGGDAGLRTPMSWTADTTRAGFSTGTPFRALAGNVATHNVAAQEADPSSLLAHYRSLLALRRAAPPWHGAARPTWPPAARCCAGGVTWAAQTRCWWPSTPAAAPPPSRTPAWRRAAALPPCGRRPTRLPRAPTPAAG
jgi:alpha-amylase